MTNSTTDASDKMPNETYLGPALLKTESKEDFAKLLEDLNRDIQPVNVIERIYVNDVANLTWDILRYRRFKAAILNSACRAALENFLRPILSGSERIEMAAVRAKQLAYDCLYDQEAKDRVSALLKEAGFDEWAVEAEAFRSRLDDVEKIDRLLASAEARREKGLRNIALYQERFARKVRQSSDRVLDADDVPSIANAGPEN